MTADFILFTIFWVTFLVMAKAAEEISIIFKNRVVNRRNRAFAQSLIVKRELKNLF